MNKVDINKYAVEKSIRSSGSYLMRNLSSWEELEVKHRKDIVTNLDIEIENKLKNDFTEILPKSKFVSEETSRKIKDDEVVWYLDPISSTSNFIHSMPHFAISACLCLKNIPTYAFVFDPFFNEFFTATKGKGAFLNNKKMTNINR